MKIQELLSIWESTAKADFTDEHYAIKLPLNDAARLHALVDMYPQQSIEHIISNLLTSALDEVESSLPYVRGENIVALDELGDPLYEDIGPTPRYLSLTQKHLDRYRQSKNGTH